MAIRVGIGLGLEKDPIQAAKEASEQAIINVQREKIDLLIVFSSIDLSYVGTLKTISASFAGVPIIGCSGAAIICNQGIFKHGLVIMALSLTEGMFSNTAYVKEVKRKTALVAGAELGETLLHGFKGFRRDLGIIFCDGLIEDGSNLVDGIQERLGRSFPLVGASASDNLEFKKTYLYFNQDILSDAACGMLWGGKLSFGLGIKHGWKPLGKPRTVTKSQGNVVHEIDNMPAVKIYEEYLAKDISELKKELKRISILYPIGIYLPGEEEYLLRNILYIEEDGSVVFQGNVPQDSQIRLMIGTKESCLAATRQAVDEAKLGLTAPSMYLDKKGTNNFVLVFDSISRYILLKREASKELEIIKEGLGTDTPIIGLYTYGEQAPLMAINYRGRAYFHNQTITVLAMGG
jgi:hypothetical protein